MLERALGIHPWHYNRGDVNTTTINATLVLQHACHHTALETLLVSVDHRLRDVRHALHFHVHVNVQFLTWAR